MKLTEKIRKWWWRVTCPSEFLCDNCVYDHGSVCKQAARPNATRCPDYKPRNKA